MSPIGIQENDAIPHSFAEACNRSHYDPWLDELRWSRFLRTAMEARATCRVEDFCRNIANDAGWFSMDAPAYRTEREYSDAELKDYAALDHYERLDVLAFETAYIHELTHRIDLLSTPQGVRFFAFLDIEHHNLAIIARQALDTPSILQRKLWLDSPHQLGQRQVAAWREWRKRTFPYLALFSRRPRSEIRRGWRGSTDQDDALFWPLPGEEVELARVDGCQTVLVPNDRDEYLKLRTLFEGRAVGHALRHILRRFARSPAMAGSEVSRYLNSNYGTGSHVSPDYVFLFELIARAVGVSNLRAVFELASNTVRTIDQFTAALQAITWYALHWPDPVESCLLAIQHFHNVLPAASADGAQYATPIELAEDIHHAVAKEQSHRKISVDELLEWYRWHSASVLNEAPSGSRSVRRCATEHIASRLEAVAAHLATRAGQGYGTPLGFPPDGNAPLYVPKANEDLLADYKCTAGFRAWWKARNRLVNTEGGLNEKIALLRAYADGHEEDSEWCALSSA